MKILLLFLASQLIAIFASLPHNDSQSQLQANQLQKSQPFPDNYTLQNQLNIQFEAEKILQSPDENWIIYTKKSGKEPPNNITIYFRNRFSFNLSSSVSFGNPSEYANQIKFTQKDNKFLLLIVTSDGNLYVCNFSSQMSDDDCELKYHATKNTSNPEDPTYSLVSIDISPQGKFAILSPSFVDSKVWLLNMTDEKIIKQNFFAIDQQYCDLLKWHPVDKEILIVAGSDAFDRQDAMMTIFNSTSNQSVTVAVLSPIASLEISQDGTVIFVGTSSGLKAYQYFGGNATIINKINNSSFEMMKFSKDCRLLSAYNSDENRVDVLSISKSSTLSASIGKFLTGSETINISVSLLYSIRLVKNRFYFSSDANQIMALKEDSYSIYQYILCPNGTYLSNMQCLKCSKNCSNCRYNETFCYSCPNNSYALIAGECHQCLEFLTGCSTCANQTFCFSCLDFFFVNQSICKLCDNHWACRSCTSQKNCTKCDDSKGFDPTPINRACQCQENFTSFNHKCVQCDITGCTLCNDTNLCVSCSSDVYEDLPGPEGTCIEKQKSESSRMIIIGCSVGGAILITIIGIVVFCRLRKKKRLKKGESIIEEREERMDREEERVHRESVQRMVEPLIVQNREKAKYSDEERIRLEKLQQSLISD